jgi:hypothetical protein
MRDHQLRYAIGVFFAGKDVLGLAAGTAKKTVEPFTLKFDAEISAYDRMPHFVDTNPTEKDPATTQAFFFYHVALQPI